MTIASTARKAGPLLGNGSTTTYPFSFKVFAAGDIKVAIANSAGVETALVEGVNYSVSLNANQETSPGGSVTYPISGAPLPTGSVLSIIGDLDYDQPLDLPSGGNFSPLALENQLDRNTMQIQQLKEQVDRSAKLPQTSSQTPDELVFNITRLGESADNIDTVASGIAAVTTVAADIADVNTVASNIGNVAATGANIAAVVTVANDLNEPVSEINTVAGSIANVDAVGANIANVNTVAGIAADVTAVAGVAADVTIVADNVADVTNFADVYYGPSATNPTLRKDGSTLQGGDLYFNTGTKRLRVFDGAAWVDGPINAGTIASYNFSGTGSQTAFTLPVDPVSENNTQVYIGGVYQSKSEYSVSGTTLTFSAAPPAGTNNIEVVSITTMALGATTAGLVDFEWGAIPADAGKVDWGVRTSVSGSNVLRWIPPSEWGAIFAGTSTYDATAAIQSAINSSEGAWVPGGATTAFKITGTLTLGFGQKLRGANARIVQYTANTPIIAVSSSKWEVSGLRLDYATQQGVADTAAMGVTFNGAFEGEFANCTISKSFKGFGVSLATSFAYECTFRNIRVIDAYDYGVAFDVNGSIGLTTNTFDNVYVLQTDVGTASPQSKGFLIQYHTGGLVMRNCAADKLAGGVLLFLKGCSGAIVDSFYAEANTMKSGSGLLSIDACADVNIRGYLPWTNTGILGAGQTASFVRITGSSRGINISGRENGTNVTGNLGTIYGIDCNSSNTAIRVNAREFVSDSGFARLDALITGSYYQVWSYSGQVFQDEVLTRKIQYRSAAPTTGTWVQGDTVINSSPSTSSPVDKWRCIIAGTPGTWRPFGSTVLRGASASRPTLGASDYGVMFMDNTLDADGKPIWWNGTAWVDATGATV